MTQRPTGITILAVLAVIGGLLSLFFGGFMALIGPGMSVEMATQSDDPMAPAVGGFMAVVGVALLLHGVLQLVTAYGLFTLKGWAWMLAVIVQVFSLVVNGLQLFQGQVGGAVVAILIAAGILYYLFRPHVKQAFGRV